MAPRQIRETLSPLRPKLVYFIAPSCRAGFARRKRVLIMERASPSGAATYSVRGLVAHRPILSFLEG